MKEKAKAKRPKAEDQVLTGWPAIAKYLGQPVAVAQRWAKDGMPVQKNGRYMTAVPAELGEWLGHQSGIKEPVHIVQAGEDDLLKSLRSGLQEARGHKQKRG
jgi:hypothetical protein